MKSFVACELHPGGGAQCLEATPSDAQNGLLIGAGET